MYRNNENNEFRQSRLAKSIFLGIIAQINPSLQKNWLKQTKYLTLLLLLYLQ